MAKNTRWRTIPYTNGFYQVSDVGDVRKVMNNVRKFNLLAYTQSKYQEVAYDIRKARWNGIDFDYPAVAYRTEYGRESKPICTLIYEAFHGIFNLSIDNIMHIDGYEFNNSISNLMLCPKDDRYKYAIDKKMNLNFTYYPTVNNEGAKTYTLHTKRYPITEYSLKGIRQNIYKGIIPATEYTGISKNEIIKVLDGVKKTHTDGKIFKLGYGPEKIDLHLIDEQHLVPYNSVSSYNFRLVFRYSLNGKLNFVYNNLKEACEKNSIQLDKLKHVITDSKILDNNIWIFE